MTTRRPWTADERATLRRLLDEGLTYPAMVPILGRNANTIRESAHRFGLVEPGSRRWTPEEQKRLIGMIEQHRSYAYVARRLGRTVCAVQERCTKIGCNLTDANGRTANATARVLGVESHTVLWWIREGWLVAHDTKARMGRGTIKIVEHDDLLAFLEDSRYWPAWQPAKIADRTLRSWAEELRAGVRFLTTGQVGDRLGLTHYAVNQLIREGRIKAAKLGPLWYVREEDAVYPPWLPKRKGKTTTPEQIEQICRLWGVIDAVLLGRYVGCSDTAVHAVARRLNLPRLGRGCWKQKATRKEIAS